MVLITTILLIAFVVIYLAIENILNHIAKRILCTAAYEIKLHKEIYMCNAIRKVMNKHGVRKIKNHILWTYIELNGFTREEFRLFLHEHYPDYENFAKEEPHLVWLSVDVISEKAHEIRSTFLFDIASKL